MRWSRNRKYIGMLSTMAGMNALNCNRVSRTGVVVAEESARFIRMALRLAPVGHDPAVAQQPFPWQFRLEAVPTAATRPLRRRPGHWPPIQYDRYLLSASVSSKNEYNNIHTLYRRAQYFIGRFILFSIGIDANWASKLFTLLPLKKKQNRFFFTFISVSYKFTIGSLENPHLVGIDKLNKNFPLWTMSMRSFLNA